MEKVRIAVIGVGNLAERVHLPLLTQFPDVDLVALCDINQDRVDHIAAKFRVQRTYTDYRALLAEEECDAVFVVVSALHVAEVATYCLARGMDTFLEKPPGITSQETRLLASTAAERGCKSMVGFNRRFQPLLNEAKTIVLNEGPIVALQAEFHPSNLDRLAGIKTERHLANMFRSNTIHSVDLLRFLAGEPVQVHSEIDSYFSPHRDSFHALIRFENGAIGHLGSNYTSPTRVEKLEIHGKRVSAYLEGLTSQATVYKGNFCYQITNSSNEALRNNGSFAQDRYFVDCVKEGRQPAYPAADLADAVKTAELLDAIEGLT